MKHSVTIWPSNATPGYIPKKITTQIIHAAQCSQLHYLQEPGHGSNLTWQHQKVNSCCTETPLLDIPEGHWWWENIPVSRTLTIAPGYSIYSGEMDRCVNIYPFIGFGQWFGGMFKAFEGKWLEIDDKEICKREGNGYFLDSKGVIVKSCPNVPALAIPDWLYRISMALFSIVWNLQYSLYMSVKHGEHSQCHHLCSWSKILNLCLK